jgi:hypothetical protein
MFGDDDNTSRKRSPHSRVVAAGSSLPAHAVLAMVAVWLSTLPHSILSPDAVHRYGVRLWG